MPSLPYSPIEKRNLSRRLPQVITTLILFGLLGFFTQEFITSPLFRIQNVEVTGNSRVSEIAVRHLANVRYNQHRLLFDSTLAEIQILQHPWVKDVHVKHSFPSAVEVEIIEYKPTLLLALNRLWYIGSEGYIFRAADNYDINHPVLTGIDPIWISKYPEIVQIIIQDALEIRTAFDLPLMGSEDNISEIHFQQETGFQVVLRNGTTLSLGFYEPVGRVERLRKMVNKGLDLSVPQQIELDSEHVAIAKPLSQL
jgi:cell division protein FtsQ